MFLGGDIGGTKTHLAIFDRDLKIRKEKIYPSHNYATFSLILEEFLKGETVSIITLGVAGPVQNGKCETTNLPWVLESQSLSKEANGTPVFLLNDLEANAYGISVLGNDDFICLNPGQKQTGNQALISAGTGLGEAGIYWDGKSHIPFASEGGHADFGPRNPLEIDLLIYLSKLFGQHVSYERVLSGIGLYYLYRFLVEVKSYAQNSEVEASKDPKDITKCAISRSCPTCKKAVEIFSEIYGAEAGNLALKMLAIGGVFIGGGIAPKILPFLQAGDFLESFFSKGRFRKLLQTIPVYVIRKENTALLGAADFGRQRYKDAL